jgi:hypothetical protein
MDARTDRIGEHAAGHPPGWATAALGPVPAHPLDRPAWQQRAAAIGAWRELSGYSDPADPIGPEPVVAAPASTSPRCARPNPRLPPVPSATGSDPGPAARRDRPVDHRPSRRAPDFRRQAC